MGNSESIGQHPQAGATFNSWFIKLDSILHSFIACPITSPQFPFILTAAVRLSQEVSYELTSTADRSGSVYDRSDYVVRELLRTSTFPNLLDWCRQIAELLQSGGFVITPEGLLTQGTEEVPSPGAFGLIIFLPTILRLCFTAKETICVVNIDELLKFVAATLRACSGNLDIVCERAPEQKTIFEVAPIILTACISNMKILNTSLFFSQFRELRLFVGLVNSAIRAKEMDKTDLLDATIECLNKYIQVAQSEADRKECQANPEFVALYWRMMTQIVEPELKAKSESRTKFRSILFFSRSLKKP
jgi:hypothetical protein